MQKVEFQAKLPGAARFMHMTFTNLKFYEMINIYRATEASGFGQ